MTRETLTDRVSALASRRGVWWLLFLVCLLYSLFALDMFVTELAVQTGKQLTGDVRPRHTPSAFLLHALLGSIALLTGILQFNRTLFNFSRKIHRYTGRIYVVSIGIAGVTGMWSALFFDVPGTARVVFVLVGSWWLASTIGAWLFIRAGNVSQHRRWMTRSFAVSLFFVSFPVWVPTLQLLAPDAVAWPVGLLLAVGINALIAEWLLHRGL